MGKGRSEIEFEEYTDLQDRRQMGREKNQEIKVVSQSFNLICLRLYFLDKIWIFLEKRNIAMSQSISPHSPGQRLVPHFEKGDQK